MRYEVDETSYALRTILDVELVPRTVTDTSNLHRRFLVNDSDEVEDFMEEE